MKSIYYFGSYPFKYFLLSLITDEFYEVSEKEFFECVGYNRRLIPMHYSKDNINKQEFFYPDGSLIGYRIR